MLRAAGFELDAAKARPDACAGGTPLVRLEGVSKTYREGSAEVRVLDDVGLELPRGETTSLIGESGAGKSTLLALIAGLLQPDAGRIEFDGTSITTLDDRARAGLRAREIGVVLQSGNLIPFLTAVENVRLAARLAGRHDDGRADALLDALGLADRRDHLPRRLSGGEAQRVAIAVALVNEPQLLLADEVTGELDSSNADQVMHFIFGAQRSRGLTVLFVTHNVDLADRATQRLRLVDGGVRPA
jgi:ABC-type lipoprotein export system ATPase subunit